MGADVRASFSIFGGLGSNYANNKVPTVNQVPTGKFDTTAALIDVGGVLYND